MIVSYCGHLSRMLVSHRLRFRPLYLNASKRLLSNEFKEVLQTRLEPPAGINDKQLQLAVVSKNLNALNLDLFANNLSPNEDRRSDILDLLVHIRSSYLANTTLESTNFAVVRHLLDNSSIQEVVPILLDRAQFGIFLNNFTGFTVVEALHREQEYELAFPLSLKMVLLDGLDSTFIQAFCVKSTIRTLKKPDTSEPVAAEAPKKPVGKQQEIKIRVRFLRNPYVPDVKHDMGKALLKVASKSLTGEAQDNAKILGYVLTKQYDKLNQVLNTTASGVSTDVFEISRELLTKADQTELGQRIEQVAAEKKAGKTLEEHMDLILSEYIIKDDKLLAEKQKELFAIWQQKRDETKKVIENEISIRERKEKIENITNEIDERKQLLWFFDEEDKLDLEIFKKRVFYPKRWFGKKKKPRVVDEQYVPPQIRKIN